MGQWVWRFRLPAVAHLVVHGVPRQVPMRKFPPSCVAFRSRQVCQEGRRFWGWMWPGAGIHGFKGCRKIDLIVSALRCEKQITGHKREVYM